MHPFFSHVLTFAAGAVLGGLAGFLAYRKNQARIQELERKVQESAGVFKR